MIRDFFQSVIHYIKKEYKFLIFIILLFIILNFPLNYYIDVGGGISDVSSRIEVEDAYESKGSFNLSYVTQIQANVLTYGLSYLIPTWDRIDIGDYKYDASEDIRDVEFRSDLDLVTAISTSEYWAYTLAGREIREVDSKIYVIATSGDEFPNELKVADEIVSVDGNRYSNVDEYIYYIQEKNVGDSVTFQIVRNKREMEVPCQIYQYEDRKLIGVVLQIAKDYEAAGADCISVLTEPKWFLGDKNFLREIAASVSIPCLRKDFTVDEYMIYEAKALGASAVLLICSILSEAQLNEYLALCNELKISAAAPPACPAVTICPSRRTTRSLSPATAA